MAFEAKFITSAAKKAQFLHPDKPMIAVCGRSNAGKSTLVNMLAGRKRLARTSAEPGRTRLVNYFDFGDYVLCDLPGYGYAAVSKGERDAWGKTLDEFFGEKGLSHVFLLSDIRRDPSDDDLQMAEYMNYYIIPFTVVATKADKVPKTRRKERVRAVAAGYKIGEDNVIAVSAQTGEGKEALLKKISETIQNAE